MDKGVSMQILNQDKCLIINNYTSIYYELVSEYHCILCSVSRVNDDTNLMLLGEYNSKERCLEVIKDISIAIVRGVKCYEMPSR
jgi:hypothetical protein